MHLIKIPACQFFHFFVLAENLKTIVFNQFSMEEKEMQENTQSNGVSNSDYSINADENAAGINHLNDPVATESELENTRAQLQEQKDRYLRLYAEFENYKRRTRAEFLDLRLTAGKDIMTSLLDVLDDCDRAEKQMTGSDDITLIREGVQLVFNKLRNTLKAKGVQPMESKGTDFDVEKHEAITEIPAAADQKGKVIDEVQSGYYLNDKIIRFAKVVVGK